MAPDLPEKLLGIDINDDDRGQRGSDDADDEPDEEYVRVVLFRVGDHRLAVPVDDVRTTTDAPDDLTPVPRTPDAIEGVTDLRGEITAVIDPSVHFPTDAAGGVREQLLIFDRPGDRQSAAIRVDEISRVESIPERDVLDAEAAASRDLSTDPLEHPLVEALLVQEHRQRRGIGTTVVSPEAAEQEPASEFESGTGSGSGSDLETASDDVLEGAIGDDGGQFDADAGASGIGASTAESEPEPDAEPEAERTPATVVEVTPLIDTERLLLAAGPTERTR